MTLNILLTRIKYMKIIIRLLINAGALLLLPYIISGIQVDSFYIAVISALILGILNILVKPIVQLLALPLTILTLGLFALIVNGIFFWFVASFVQGFSVAGFWEAFLGALIMSVVSWITNKLILN